MDNKSLNELKRISYNRKMDFRESLAQQIYLNTPANKSDDERAVIAWNVAGWRMDKKDEAVLLLARKMGVKSPEKVLVRDNGVLVILNRDGRTYETTGREV